MTASDLSVRPDEAPWLRSYPKDVDWAGAPTIESLSDAFTRSVRRFSDHPCIDFMGRIYSYEEVGRLVDRAAAGLRRLGVAPGDRVGLFLPNTPYFVVFYYAALKVGGVVVNFSPLYAEEEVRRQIEDSGAKVMVTLDLKVLLPKLTSAIGRTPLETVIVCPMRESLPTAKGLLFTLFKRADRAPMPTAPGFVAFNDVVTRSESQAAHPVDPAGDVAVLQYTGGTTGIPKGAMLTHGNLTANRSQIAALCPSLRMGGETMIGVLPLFHVFAMTVVMNLSLSIGAKMVLLPRFELDQLLKALNRTKPTLFAGVPSLYNVINQTPDIRRKVDFSALRYCISGGAPLPNEIRETFEKIAGCRLVEGYGLSESAPVATCNPFDGSGKPGSIGLPLPRTRIEIRDPEDPERLLPPGERGEICVIGPQVMKGYWQRPDETAKTLHGARLHTGDIGYMDEDGYTFLTDRLKDVILTNGYNVYPRIIEDAIYRHEAVAETTVIAIPDAQRGQSAKAFVAPKAGRSLTDSELRAFLANKLSPIEMPVEYEFRESLPKTMVGKLSKKELIEEDRAKRGIDTTSPN